MLISFDGVPAGLNGNDPRKKVFSCLASCKRATDFLGWYKSGSVIGIVFTDICISDIGTASERITERIESKLASIVELGYIEKINISFHVFPERLESDALSTHFTLYPDVMQSHYSQKRPKFFNRVIDAVGSLCH